MIGKELILGFFLSQLLDILSTLSGIRFMHLNENNPVADYLFKTIGMEEFMVIKLLISMTLIALYILAIKRFRKWLWTLEKSLQVGSVTTWTVGILNVVTILVVENYRV